MARPQHISDTSITDALATRPEVTAADLADLLGIGQSTAAKRLAALEAAGSARRTPGGRVRGVRVADRWSLAAPVPETASGSPAIPDPAIPDPAGVEPDHPASDADGSGVDAPEAAPPEVADAGAATTDGGGGRLGKGELGSLVRDYLAARPGEAFGPTQVGKALGRSQGAVSNSLAKMAANGEVVLVADNPRRYRIAS